MSTNNRLTKKHILLIVLCTVAIIALIAGGSAVYAKYTKNHTVGSGLSIEVQTDVETALVTKDYNSNVEFDDISAVFPFG